MTTDDHNQREVLSYSSVPTQAGSLPQWFLWLAATLSMPAPLFVVILFTSGYWSVWFKVGQRNEIICGELWIAAAASSVACLFVLMLCRKRWCIWLSLALQLLFLALTLFPGCVLIPWLLHLPTGAPD